MNYTTLKASISDWIARSDLADATLDDFIDLAEARINRKLRIRAMETTYFRALDSDSSAAVPDSWLQWRNSFLYKGTPTVTDTFNELANALTFPLNTTTVGGAAESFAQSAADGRSITRIGSRFYVSGKPSGTYTLGGIYYAAFTALSSVATTNWLTTNAPDLLLAACLSEASAYVKSDRQVLYWTTRFTSLIDELQDQDTREAWAGEQMVMRP